MRTRRLIIGAILAALAMAGPRALADDEAGTGVAAGDEDRSIWASWVLAVFREKCAGCHGTKPKKPDKFNFILDLKKLAATPKYVVPGDPTKGMLYAQISKNEMPPQDSDVKPLNELQKKVILDWIVAGAPTGLPSTQPVAEKPKERPFSKKLVIFLGKFHPIAAHTPIALLMAAAIAEWFYYFRQHAPALIHVARFCAVFGALGAVATAALGWAMAATHTSSDLLESHRWAGTIAGIASIPIALVGEWGARRAHREHRPWHGFSRWFFRLSVFAVAGLIGFTGHLGGLIHWGEDFLTWPK
jgi:uncharacterized membrane protein